MTAELDPARLPAHIAIIMDGNGRWAKKRGLPRILGHRAGVKTVHEIVEACSDLSIKVLTLYAFSTENWVRPQKEVSGLMTLMKTFLKKEMAGLVKNNVRVRAIGDISRIPAMSREVLLETIKATEGNTGMVLNLALNYGGRQEIVRAVNALIAQGHATIDEDMIGQTLDTGGLPDPDLLIRTSGEMRISNFLLWQAAYAELYVTPVLWPDFKTKNLVEAIANYQSRDRRFGGVKA